MRSEERKTLRETRCELGRYNADVMSTAPISLQTSEEFRIFAERCMHFMNLWTVYTDLLSGHYVPRINLPSEESLTDVRETMMLILYAYFYSLIEDDDQSINGFRIWRARFPEETAAIAAVEAQVVPFRQRLKLFRNRLGFHGSRSRTHESSGLDLFAQHSGTEIWDAMKSFKALSAALFAKCGAQQGLEGSDPDRARQWIDSVAARAGQSAKPRAAGS